MSSKSVTGLQLGVSGVAYHDKNALKHLKHILIGEIMCLVLFTALGQKPEVRPQTENLTSDSNSLRQTDPEPLITAYLDQLQKVRDFFKLSVLVLGLQFRQRNRVRRPQFDTS